LLLVCTTWVQSNTNIAKENYNFHNPNIYPTFHYYSYILKKTLQIFCVAIKYDNDSKEWCFLLKQMIIQKNVWYKQECD
jgi:hypothetical protein